VVQYNDRKKSFSCYDFSLCKYIIVLKDYNYYLLAVDHMTKFDYSISLIIYARQMDVFKFCILDEKDISVLYKVLYATLGGCWQNYTPLVVSRNGMTKISS
jgi:hypothetical protein